MVYEHASGGGLIGETIESEILCEGFAMLKTIITDLAKAGHNVVTALDSRLATFSCLLKADIKQVRTRNELKKEFGSWLSQADATLVVAPETDGILAGLLRLVEQHSKLSLNSDADAVAAASDKYQLYQRIRAAGLSTPETVCLELSVPLKDCLCYLRQLSYPVVLKPVRSVGCASVSLVRNELEAGLAIRRMRKQNLSTRILAQRFVAGLNASVSAIVSKNRCLPISLNQQFVTLASPPRASKYMGGCLPLDNPLREEAFRMAVAAVNMFPGLRGYVGIDMVLADGGAFIVEINPRLTTSYVGISTLSPVVAQAIIGAGMDEEIDQPIINGYAYFSKIKCPSLGGLNELRHRDWLVCPPTAGGQAMIVSKGDSPDEAARRFREIRRRLSCR